MLVYICGDAIICSHVNKNSNHSGIIRVYMCGVCTYVRMYLYTNSFYCYIIILLVSL